MNGVVWIVLLLLASIAVSVLNLRELRALREDARPELSCPDLTAARALDVLIKEPDVRRPARAFRVRRSFRDERAKFERANDGRQHDDREIGKAL
jgi:hypothetical protein